MDREAIIEKQGEVVGKLLDLALVHSEDSARVGDYLKAAAMTVDKIATLTLLGEKDAAGRSLAR